MKLRLTRAQMGLGMRCGKMRADLHDRENRRGGYGFKGGYKESLAVHQDGACFEVLGHVYYKQPWIGFSPNWRKIPADVGGVLNFRSTRWPGGGLIVHPRDPADKIYVLGRLNLPDIELVGWMWGHEIKIPKFWGRPPHFRNKVYFTKDPADMHPMETLDAELEKYERTTTTKVPSVRAGYSAAEAKTIRDTFCP